METLEKSMILVIDDQEMNLVMADRALREKYEILKAESAEMGFDILVENQNRIDLILLDIVLPEMDGFQFMEKMKISGFSRIPVIIMTADGEPKREMLALEKGAVDFIRKPLYASILQNRVRNALMRNRMEYDMLTGFYNRRRMFEKTRQLIKEHPGKKYAFIRYDIDHFSIYNSAMGEEEGNKLLLYGAATMKKMASEYENCVYGRIDADIFALCEEYDQEKVEGHILKAARLLGDYRDDYELKASAGIYVFEDPNTSIETAYTNATLAAHMCKDIYDQHFAYYEEWMDRKYKEEQEITNEMVTALAQGHFVPYLQPKYNLTSDEPCGAEALVRWIHPEKGIISPGKFIPVFERNGFITKLDYYMWEAVCKLLHRWKKEGKEVYPISVNISRISMYNPHLAQILLDLVKKYEIEPELLQLEITESAYMTNPELMKSSINRLQRDGFEILMDDFGSGYSSLNTLKEINVDVLKIDMKFLPSGDNTSRSEKILSSIIRMAGWLNIPTIAEGVETERQRDFLKGIGCNYVQGFYYARPMPVEQYEELMEGTQRLLVDEKKIAMSTIAWSSNQIIDEIMTGIQLPIAIVEMSSMRTEVIRSNHHFNTLFQRDIMDHIIRNRKEQILKIFENAQEEENAEGEIPFQLKTGEDKFYRIKVKCLEKVHFATLLCVTFIDITAEKNYEMQLHKLERLAPSHHRTKILIVDDSQSIRDIIRQMFQSDYGIIEAEDGVQALEILKSQYEEIAIVLLDMIMPKMTGRELLVEKRKIQDAENIPVIVISVEKDTSLQLDMLSLGVIDYVTKPFDRNIFRMKVKNAILFAEQFAGLRREHIAITEEGYGERENDWDYSTILDESDEMIQIAEAERMEMLYANHPAEVFTDHAAVPYAGEKCYHYMMGLDEQCSFCPARKLQNQDELTTEVDNGVQVFRVKVKRIHWQGKDAIIEYATDITQLKRAQESFDTQMKKFVDSVPEAQGIFHINITKDIWLSTNGISEIVDELRKTQSINGLVEGLTSYIPDEDMKKRVYNSLCRESLLASYSAGRTEIPEETLSYYDDGSIRWSRITARLLLNPSTGDLEGVIYGMDISNERKYQEKMEKAEREKARILKKSKQDILTNVYNKNAFAELANDYIKAKPEQAFAVIFIDLDNFKAVNDNLGHLIGDRAIIDTAEELQSIYSNKDIISRFGGDEFCLLIKDITREKLLDKLDFTLKKLVRVYRENDIEVKITASMGVAYCKGQTQNIKPWIEKADTALYHAKRNGRNQYHFS